MAKMNIMLEISVVVDTDIEGVEDVVNNLDIEIKPNSENVEVDNYSIDNFYDFFA